MLSCRLLGQVVLYNDQQPLSQFRSQKEAALLIYLAQTGQVYSRDFIAELFWDGRTTQQALSNLRTALARLRKQVDEALVVTRASLSLAPESRQQVDSVRLLETLARVGKVGSAEEANLLEKTLDAYSGDFLADFYVSDAPQFDAWVTTTREQIRRQVIAACTKLGDYALSTGDVDYAIATARRWLQVDALDEAAHFLLMQALIAAGRVGEAVTHYDACVELLRTELGVPPSAKMTALIQGARPQPVLRHRLPASRLHNLPAAYDPFFGRVEIQKEIHARLEQSWCRLITIVGPGGMGKTRLATTIARSRLNHYTDGVWLVELAETDPDDPDVAEAIAVEIATAIDLRLSGPLKPAEQLLAYLQNKQLLLVLDNFEHLIKRSVQFVLDIIQRCESVQLLVTAREPLSLRSEWTILLPELGYPASDGDDSPSDAVDLFTARRSQQQWQEIGSDDLAPVRQICRILEGLPLAIELAAGLTDSASVREIADELGRGFEALTSSLRDVPQRHRSLQAVFEMSWRTLSPALQLRLARLSVFRGGFTQAAARSIADADERDLAALCGKSLLSYAEAAERYRLHPVVRTYAAGKLLATDQAAQKHTEHYLTLLAQQTEPLQKDDLQSAMAVIEPDIANMRLAWQTGLAQREASLLSAALTSLSIYYQLRGLAYEGETVMQATVHAATAQKPEIVPLAIRAGLERARFQNRLGRYRPAIQTIEMTLPLAAQCDDRWADGMGHVLWGESLWRLGEYAAAQNRLIHALDSAHALDATPDAGLLIGWCHHHLGIIDDIQSRYAAARDHLQQACEAWQLIDNTQALSNSLNSIGLVCYHQGDWSAAQQAMEQSLTLCNQIDNRHLQSLLLNNLSMLSTKQGDYLSAHHYLQLGLDLATKSGNLTSQGEIYSNLGRNYSLLGEPTLAIENLERGLQIAESLENRSLMAEMLFHLAYTRSAQEDSRAESLYKQALTIAHQNNLHYTECEILIGMAELLSKIDERQAREYSGQAVALAKTMQNPDLLSRANAIDAYLNVPASVNEGNLSV